MGFLDRLVGRVEQRNTEAVYERSLEQLDAKIAAHVERIAALKVDGRTRALRGDGSEQGYDVLIEEAERLLGEMRANRRALELERHAGPAAKAVAEARVQVDDEASGLGASSASQALSSVRDDLDALQRRASPGLIDANGVPIHGRQAQLDRKAKEDRAREELERLKRDLKK